MEKHKRTLVRSVPITIQVQEPEPEVHTFIPFPERGPEMTRLQAWWKYHTTKDRWGYYPMETERNYKLLGIGYLLLIPFAVLAFILVLA